MKAIQIDNYGETPTVQTVPDPVAAPGQVVVRILAASFNPVDAKMASGNMRQIFPLTFPWTPGADFSGVVESLGEGVNTFRIGDEVFGDTMGGGGYAEKIAVAAESIALKPRTVSHIEAASLAVVAQTATQALDAAHLQSGQTILIQGAAGGVGSAAVQLAHARGAHVIATASTETLDYVAALGADQVIDYKTTPFETVLSNIDVVLDGIGGETQQRSFAVLKPGGYLIALSQPPSPEEAAKHNVHASMLQTQSNADTLKTLAARIDSGDIKPTIGKTYPITEVAKAWQEWPTLHLPGKLVFDLATW